MVSRLEPGIRCSEDQNIASSSDRRELYDLTLKKYFCYSLKLLPVNIERRQHHSQILFQVI